MRRVRVAGCGFWLLFSAYSAAQALVTSLYPSSGYVCLSLLYGLFVIALLATPFLTASLPPRWVLPCAATVYLYIVAACIQYDPQVLLSGCALVGLAAAPLWGAQGLYVSRASVAYARRTGTTLSDSASLMNSAFFGIFVSAGGASYLMASTVLVVRGVGSSPLLFALLLGVGTLGVLLLACLVDADELSSRSIRAPLCMRMRCPRFASTRPEKPSLAQPPPPQLEASQPPLAQLQLPQSEALPQAPVVAAAAPAALPSHGPPPPLAYVLRFMATERHVLLLAPALLSFGSMMGCWSGLWLGALAGGGIGAQYVGYVGAVYAFTVATSTIGWTRFIKSRGRACAFALAALSYTAFWLLSIGWSARYPPGSAAEEQPSFGASLAFLLTSAVLYSLGDGVWVVQLPAVLQSRFSSGRDAACVNSVMRLYIALGVAVQTGISAGLGPGRAVWQQLLAAAVAFFAACCVLAYAHYFEIDLDTGTPRRVNKPGLASADGCVDEEGQRGGAACAPGSRTEAQREEPGEG